MVWIQVCRISHMLFVFLLAPSFPSDCISKLLSTVAGLFMATLLNKLENMMNNSLAVNLLHNPSSAPFYLTPAPSFTLLSSPSYRYLLCQVPHTGILKPDSRNIWLVRVKL